MNSAMAGTACKLRSIHNGILSRSGASLELVGGPCSEDAAFLGGRMRVGANVRRDQYIPEMTIPRGRAMSIMLRFRVRRKGIPGSRSETPPAVMVKMAAKRPLMVRYWKWPEGMMW